MLLWVEASILHIHIILNGLLIMRAGYILWRQYVCECIYVYINTAHKRIFYIIIIIVVLYGLARRTTTTITKHVVYRHQINKQKKAVMKNYIRPVAGWLLNSCIYLLSSILSEGLLKQKHSFYNHHVIKCI